ncbi:MAG: glycine dehydrogenase subunit 1 [bacterium]|jgi:glycine dehydrogenase subunit 1
MKRYLPHTEQDRKEMLQASGVQSVDDFYNKVPVNALLKNLLDLPLGKGEMHVERDMENLAEQNHKTSDGPFFLGAGYYNHHIPATADHIIQRSEFLTAYTPYQPEVSQGTLTAIFEFQTYIKNLTGQEVANASMYDGATALAEAVLMAKRVLRHKKNDVYIADGLHPQYKQTLDTYLNHSKGEFVTEATENTACVIVQYPNFYGEVPDLKHYRKLCDDVGALLIVCTNEIVSLGLLQAPTVADISVGEAQSIGVPLSFGGPSLGFFASKKQHLRQMPGRICGQTTDADGKRSFVLTLNTREQHIRRDKATSNICTNEGLCALAFTVHMSLLGEVGFKQLALLNHERAQTLAQTLEKIKGVQVLNTTYFNEFVIETPLSSDKIITHLEASGIIAGHPISEKKLLVCATEMTSNSDIQSFAAALDGLINT